MPAPLLAPQLCRYSLLFKGVCLVLGRLPIHERYLDILISITAFAAFDIDDLIFFSTFYSGSRAVLRFNTELQRANDPQLNEAMKLIAQVKKHGNHITAMLSHADLIQLGGYTAVEYCGGPSMLFKMGRVDVETEGEASNALAIIPDASHENAVIVKKFDMMGLEADEYVAIMGAHTLGFANDSNKSKTGRWCMNPYVFDNTYFKEVLMGHDSIYLKTEADLRLL